MLGTGGFHRLSELLYLVCLNSEFPTAPLPTSLEFEVYSPANHRRLAAMVEATYQKTLDCPQLNGVRQIEDVLAGYRGCGVFDESRWLIVRHGGSDVGCLLLSDYPDYDNWELVYMGVAPWVRGKGWGIEIVRYAQWRAAASGSREVGLGGRCGQSPGDCDVRGGWFPGMGPASRVVEGLCIIVLQTPEIASFFTEDRRPTGVGPKQTERQLVLVGGPAARRRRFPRAIFGSCGQSLVADPTGFALGRREGRKTIPCRGAA